MTEDEMVGSCHRINGHKFEQTPGDGEGQGSRVLQSMGPQRVGHNLATEQPLAYKPCLLFIALLEPSFPFTH